MWQTHGKKCRGFHLKWKTCGKHMEKNLGVYFFSDVYFDCIYSKGFLLFTGGFIHKVKNMRKTHGKKCTGLVIKWKTCEKHMQKNVGVYS